MAGDDGGGERAPRADARRNRARILEAAGEVFAERGAEAQMCDVADRARVGVGTLYRHFPTKEALMAELVRAKFRLLVSGVRDALERDGDPFVVFVQMLHDNADVCARDASIQHALTATGQPIWAHAEREQAELLDLTGQLMARAQRAGTMRTDVRAADVGMLLCGVSATMAHRSPGFEWRRHLELMIDALRAH